MEKYFIFLFYRWRIYYFFSFYRLSKISKERYFIYRFVQGIIWIISHFIDGEYGRYPILSICPGDSMDKIRRISKITKISKISKERYFIYRFVQGIIWTISYFIDGEYGRYPILSICPGDSMDKIRRISKITKISKISKERYFIFLFYPRKDILFFYSIHGEIFYFSIFSMENMDDILFFRFVQGIIWIISHFIDGEYGRYPILSMENMDDIPFYRWRIWTISYFIDLSRG